MLNKVVKSVALVAALAVAPSTFAMGMGGMGMGGMGMGGMGMRSAVVLTSNGLMSVSSVRSFGSDDLRSVSATVLPTTVLSNEARELNGDNRPFVTVPATNVIGTTVIRSNEAFESRRFGRDFR